MTVHKYDKLICRLSDRMIALAEVSEGTGMPLSLNQSSTILKLHKYFLVNCRKISYNNINKGAFELNKE